MNIYSETLNLYFVNGMSSDSDLMKGSLQAAALMPLPHRESSEGALSTVNQLTVFLDPFGRISLRGNKARVGYFLCHSRRDVCRRWVSTDESGHKPP